jgi:hypothetical protein
VKSRILILCSRVFRRGENPKIDAPITFPRPLSLRRATSSKAVDQSQHPHFDLTNFFRTPHHHLRCCLSRAAAAPPISIACSHLVASMQSSRALLRTTRAIRPSTFSASRPIRFNSNSTTSRGSDRVSTNDPTPSKDISPVSATNEVPVSKQGIEDGYMVESVEAGEKQRQMQAPNRQATWSRSQQPRHRAMSGPRFEQTIMEYQVGWTVIVMERVPWEVKAKSCGMEGKMKSMGY